MTRGKRAISVLLVLVALSELTNLVKDFLNLNSQKVKLLNYNQKVRDYISQHHLNPISWQHELLELDEAPPFGSSTLSPPLIIFASAKGVAGLGKAGGDAQGGSDKAGQQVPPEVYNALTYAGTAFLFTLSVPLILYGLNKLLNKIQDCFGCGPSNERKKTLAEQQSKIRQQQEQLSPQRDHLESNLHIQLANSIKNKDNINVFDSRDKYQIKAPKSNKTNGQSFDPELNCKTQTEPLHQQQGHHHQNRYHKQPQQQHPYFISSPHL